jgi:acyl-CoA dehydrogenase
MSDARAMIAESVERVFADALDHDAVARAETGVWPADLWAAVEGAGITRVLLDEERGGAGGDWLDVFEIARAAGRHAVPLPLVETILAASLLERAGLDVPDGPLGLACRGAALEKGARLERVPWGRFATHLVALVPAGAAARVACWPRAGLALEEGRNLALEPRDSLTLDGTKSKVGDVEIAPNAVHFHGALLRCGQMVGALERILDQSVQYASERVQFGRTIGSFQIIQQDLARLAGQVAEATVATEVAFRAAAEADASARGRIGAARDPAFEIACAKIVAGEAAELGPRIAHQIHGAIGFTYEHSLHFATRRLWAWRAEFGLAEEWAAELGSAVQDEYRGEIWQLVTSR